MNVKIDTGEEVNAGIAYAMARPAYSSGKLDDEASVNFHSQKPVKPARHCPFYIKYQKKAGGIKRHGYNTIPINDMNCKS